MKLALGPRITAEACDESWQSKGQNFFVDASVSRIRVHSDPVPAAVFKEQNRGNRPRITAWSSIATAMWKAPRSNCGNATR